VSRYRDRVAKTGWRSPRGRLVIIQAKRQGALSCGHDAQVGQQIASRGSGWLCMDCAQATRA
jgi:hypothetical protein